MCRQEKGSKPSNAVEHGIGIPGPYAGFELLVLHFDELQVSGFQFMHPVERTSFDLPL